MKCDWEVIEGEDGEFDGVIYYHYICNECGTTTWDYEWPIDCMEKE